MRTTRQTKEPIGTHLRARLVSGHLVKRKTTTEVGPFGGAAGFGSGKGRNKESNGELHGNEMLIDYSRILSKNNELLK